MNGKILTAAFASCAAVLLFALGACDSASSDSALKLLPSVYQASPGAKVGISARITTSNGQIPVIRYYVSAGEILPTAVSNEIDVILPSRPGKVTVTAKAEAGSDSWSAETVIDTVAAEKDSKNTKNQKNPKEIKDPEIVSVPSEPIPLAGKSVVTRFFPPNSAKDVPPDSRIILEFSEAMDQRAVSSAFVIKPPVSGVFTWNGLSCCFIPDAPFLPGTTYSATLKHDMLARDGTMLKEGLAWKFSVK